MALTDFVLSFYNKKKINIEKAVQHFPHFTPPLFIGLILPDLLQSQ
jgi:hypothetical protein